MIKNQRTTDKVVIAPSLDELKKRYQDLIRGVAGLKKESKKNGKTKRKPKKDKKSKSSKKNKK